MYRSDIRNALLWLSFSGTAKPRAFIAEALISTFEGGIPQVDAESREAILGVLDLLASLVVVYYHPSEDRNLDQFRIGHFSVKEYLLSDRIRIGTASAFAMDENTIHAWMSRTCIAYILYHFSMDGPERDALLRRESRKYTFLSYAVHNWVVHQRAVEVNSVRSQSVEVDVSMSTMLLGDSSTTARWVGCHRDKTLSDECQVPGGPYDLGLMLACRLGLLRTAEEICDHATRRDRGPLNYRLALAEATRLDLPVIVERILASGHYGDADNCICHYALYAASKTANERLATRLLNHCSSMTRGLEHIKSLDMALDMAIDSRHRSSLIQLFAWGARFDLRRNRPREQLYLAIRDAPNSAVDHIFASLHDREVNTVQRGSPLHIACRVGRLNWIQNLLSNKEDIDEISVDNRTPLVEAVESGKLAAVEILLESGADLNLVMPEAPVTRMTALMIACLFSDDRIAIEVVQTLIDAGADARLLHPFLTITNAQIARTLANFAPPCLYYCCYRDGRKFRPTTAIEESIRLSANETAFELSRLRVTNADGSTLSSSLEFLDEHLATAAGSSSRASSILTRSYEWTGEWEDFDVDDC